MFEPIHLRSKDQRFELCLPGELMYQVQSRCISAGLRETGGILVGRYSEDLRIAEVTAISDCPNDSTSGHISFVRGIKGLCRWLQILWKGSSYYYLGEWHFHPVVNIQPSSQDLASMIQIASAEPYRCPEPILLIVSGNDTKGWRLYAQVTISDEKIVVLNKLEQTKKGLK